MRVFPYLTAINFKSLRYTFRSQGSQVTTVIIFSLNIHIQSILKIK